MTGIGGALCPVSTRCGYSVPREATINIGETGHPQIAAFSQALHPEEKKLALKSGYLFSRNRSHLWLPEAMAFQKTISPVPSAPPPHLLLI
jgi:hypothetical protein